jgi:hypothetical protein
MKTNKMGKKKLKNTLRREGYILNNQFKNYYLISKNNKLIFFKFENKKYDYEEFILCNFSIVRESMIQLRSQ